MTEVRIRDVVRRKELVTRLAVTELTSVLELNTLTNSK
jgi:hypothetical protein